MLPAAVSVDVEVLSWAVSTEDIGVLHPVVAPTAVWRPRAALAEVDGVARAECGRLGWLDRRGRLDVEVVAALAVVCRPAVEFYGWVNDGERTVGVLSAAIGKNAVLVVRDADVVRLSHVRAEELPEMLVGQLPEVPAGRVRPVRIELAELAATTRDGRRRSESGVGTYPASESARLVRQLADLPVLGTGELHVAVRDALGRRRTVPEPVRYQDTPQGRFGYMVSGAGGEESMFLAGVSRPDLVARLREAHRTLTR
jgi:EspG family